MDSNQIIIKIILIATFSLVALAIVLPGRSARGQAIRHLAWLLGLAVGMVAIIFPQLTSTVARWLGVGRGTDLVLYLAIIFFLGYVVTTSAHIRRMDRTTTVLARKIAILEADLRAKSVLAMPADLADEAEESKK